MKNHSHHFISLLTVTLLILFTACSKPPEKDWVQKTRDVFGTTKDSKHLILLIREDQNGEMSRYSPMLVVPAGSGFDQYTALAFLPDDDAEPQGGNNENGDEAPDDEAEPENDQENNDGEDGDEGNSEEDDQADDESTASPFDDWPPSMEPWLDDDDDGDDEDEGDDAEEDDQIDKELKEALERAYEDEEPGDTEEEDEDRIRLRYWTPRFPVPIPWWKPNTDLPDVPELPDFDFELPRWKDLEDDQDQPPFWLPPGEAWPPREYDLPDQWKPSDSGFKLGEWRIYIQPLPED